MLWGEGALGEHGRGKERAEGEGRRKVGKGGRIGIRICG